MMTKPDPILAILIEKMRRSGRDRSRHLVCPRCVARTKLYALADGRKKCSVCKAKFLPEKKYENEKLRQYADTLRSLMLGLSARQASAMTKHRYRTVAVLYGRFRMFLSSQNLTPGKIQILMRASSADHTVHDSAFCRRCRGRFACKGRKSGDSPVFGVKILSDGSVFIDPLEENEACLRFDRPLNDSHGKFSAYAGFICHGKFHRFADNGRLKDGAERLWAWMSERLRKHHGIWKRNAGSYLKELEWKYNNRSLAPEAQAVRIAELMPTDFLQSWGREATIPLDLVRKTS